MDDVDIAAADWAQSAATDILDHFKDSAAIETADYRLCDFILAAAKLATEDSDFARRIGEAMEPPRSAEDAERATSA